MMTNSVTVQPTVILPPDLDAALADRAMLIDHGFSIIPLIDTTKLPAISWAIHQEVRASLDKTVAWMCGEGLFTKHPRRPDIVVVTSEKNLGIVTGAISGIVVLDLDDDNAIDRAEALGLPCTVCAATPRGRHVYFRHPGGMVANATDIFSERRRSVSDAPSGFDLRGDGGFVVGAGSEFIPTPDEAAAGKVAGTYRWIVSPGEAGLADMPDWLIAELAYRHPEPAQAVSRVHPAAPLATSQGQLRAERWTAAVVAHRCQAIVDAPNGTQNDTIFKSAAKLGSLVAGGLLDDGEAMGALTSAAAAGNHPRGPAKASIKSGLARGKHSPIFGPPDPISPAGVPMRRMNLTQALKLARGARA